MPEAYISRKKCQLLILAPMPTRGAPTLRGSAAMYREGTASRPPTAEGLADSGVQENEICTRGVPQGPHYGAVALPAVRVLAAPQTR